MCLRFAKMTSRLFLTTIRQIFNKDQLSSKKKLTNQCNSSINNLTTKKSQISSKIDEIRFNYNDDIIDEAPSIKTKKMPSKKSLKRRISLTTSTTKNPQKKRRITITPIIDEIQTVAKTNTPTSASKKTFEEYLSEAQLKNLKMTPKRRISLMTPKKSVFLTPFKSPKIFSTPTQYEIKSVQIIKAVDNTKLACFFTKVYVFSNHFYRTDLIDIDGRKYICSEQYYMYYKAYLFSDFGSAAKILRAKTPSEIKKIGSQIQNFDLKKWKKVSIQIMVIACLRKFQQNSDLRKHLFETEDAQLVEASPFDDYWGIGMGLDDTELNNPKKWRGKNVMGRLLTKLRKILKKDPKYDDNIIATPSASRPRIVF